MCRRGEGTAGDFREESGCSPDADSGHAGQDRSKNPLFHLKGHLVSLPTQREELECQAWQNHNSCIRADNDDGLLCKCLGDIRSKAFSQTGSEYAELGCQLFLSQLREFFG